MKKKNNFQGMFMPTMKDASFEAIYNEPIEIEDDHQTMVKLPQPNEGAKIPIVNRQIGNQNQNQNQFDKLNIQHPNPQANYGKDYPNLINQGYANQPLNSQYANQNIVGNTGQNPPPIINISKAKIDSNLGQNNNSTNLLNPGMNQPNEIQLNAFQNNTHLEPIDIQNNLNPNESGNNLNLQQQNQYFNHQMQYQRNQNSAMMMKNQMIEGNNQANLRANLNNFQNLQPPLNQKILNQIPNQASVATSQNNNFVSTNNSQMQFFDQGRGNQMNNNNILNPQNQPPNYPVNQSQMIDPIEHLSELNNAGNILPNVKQEFINISQMNVKQESNDNNIGNPSNTNEKYYYNQEQLYKIQGNKGDQNKFNLNNNSPEKSNMFQGNNAGYVAQNENIRQVQNFQGNPNIYGAFNNQAQGINSGNQDQLQGMTKQGQMPFNSNMRGNLGNQAKGINSGNLDQLQSIPKQVNISQENPIVYGVPFNQNQENMYKFGPADFQMKPQDWGTGMKGDQRDSKEFQLNYPNNNLKNNIYEGSNQLPSPETKPTNQVNNLAVFEKLQEQSASNTGNLPGQNIPLQLNQMNSFGNQQINISVNSSNVQILSTSENIMNLNQNNTKMLPSSINYNNNANNFAVENREGSYNNSAAFSNQKNVNNTTLIQDDIQTTSISLIKGKKNQNQNQTQNQNQAPTQNSQNFVLKPGLQEPIDTDLLEKNLLTKFKENNIISLDNLKSEMEELSKIPENSIEINKFNSYRALSIEKDDDFDFNFFLNLIYILIFYQLKNLSNEKRETLKMVFLSFLPKISRDFNNNEDFLSFLVSNSTMNSFTQVVYYVLQNPIVFALKKHHYSWIKYSKNINDPLIFKDCIQAVAKYLPISFCVHYLGKEKTYSKYKIQNISENSNLYQPLFKINIILSPRKLIYLQEDSKNQNQGGNQRNKRIIIDSTELENFHLYIKGLNDEVRNCNLNSINPSQKAIDYVKDLILNFESSFGKKSNLILNKIKNDFEKLCASVVILGEERNKMQLKREDSLNNNLDNQNSNIENGLYSKQLNPSLCMFCQTKMQAPEVIKNCGENILHPYHAYCFSCYLNKMADEGKALPEIKCLICGKQFETHQIAKTNENAFKSIQETTKLKLKEDQKKDTEDLSSPLTSSEIKNTHCDHQYFPCDLVVYLNNNANNLRIMKEVKCPGLNCNKYIDDKIIIKVLKDQIELMGKEKLKESSALIQSTNQMKEIKRVVVLPENVANSEEEAKKKEEIKQNMKPVIPIIENKQNAKDPLILTNPLCNHKFNQEMFDILIDSNSLMQETPKEIMCPTITDKVPCTQILDMKLIEESKKRLDEKKEKKPLEKKEEKLLEEKNEKKPLEEKENKQ